MCVYVCVCESDCVCKFDCCITNVLHRAGCVLRVYFSPRPRFTRQIPKWTDLAAALSVGVDAWKSMTVPREVLVRLRDGRVQRDEYELNIYARFLELLLSFVALPKAPPKQDLFWFRFFGVLCGEVPVHTFASALRLHLILDHKQNLPNPGVFETIMMHTVDCEDEDGKIESSEWSSFLARYGPTSTCLLLGHCVLCKICILVITMAKG
jgi:hypothetical protein